MPRAWSYLGVAVVATLLAGRLVAADAPAAPTPPAAPTALAEKPMTNVLTFALKDINGQDAPLKQYEGKVLLLVNVASKCGLTPQYKQLQEVYTKYQPQGLVILGFPANNFGGQEPGTHEQIVAFCTKNYGVTFPLYGKVSVKGQDQCEFYRYLTSKETNPAFAGDITWNFEKFLVNRHGAIVARFSPKTRPDAPEVIKAIEAELARQN